MRSEKANAKKKCGCIPLTSLFPPAPPVVSVLAPNLHVPVLPHRRHSPAQPTPLHDHVASTGNGLMCHVLLHTSPQPPLAPHALPGEISSDSEGSKHQPMVSCSMRKARRWLSVLLSAAVRPRPGLAAHAQSLADLRAFLPSEPP